MGYYEDKLILITGGGGGIGRETARVFLDAGASVRLVDPSAQALNKVAADLSGGDRLQTHLSDLSTQDKCEAALTRQGATPYAVVHLAGISLPDPDDIADMSCFDATFEANVRNAYQLSRAFHAMHSGTKEQPSRMVFTSSLAFRRGGLDRIAYSASKGAVAGMIRAMARRYAPTIHVNGIAPGIVLTPMTRQLIGDRGDRLMSEIPIGRFAEPREIATVIEFLCGPGSSYVNGQIINVDGGTIHS